MPDFTITSESLQARLDARLKAAAVAAAVERRGSAICPQCRGKKLAIVASIYGHPPEYGPCPTCSPEAELDWIEVGNDGTATAGDGVYLVRPVRTGYLASEFIDGIETLSRIMPEGLCREWCAARHRDRGMSKTKEHKVDVAHEVGESQL